MNKYVKKIIGFFLIIMTICIFLNYSKAITPDSQNIYEGIDVSNWQGYISYNDVKNAGIDIVYIKASQGTTYKDPYMEYNYKEAKSNGLKVGFYHFLTATNEVEAKKQAHFFVSVISGKEVDCKLAMDFEQFNDGITVNDIRRISNVFLETVKQLTGKDVIVYSNLNDAKNVFGSEIASKYPLWLAYYTTENRVLSATSSWNVWYGWQYTSRGTVSGINGYVDRNKFTSNILLKQSSEIPKVEVPEDIKLNRVEYIVKKGDTLSEIAMKYSTTVAEIASQNNISNPNLIYPGQIIYIYTNNTQNVETNEMGCIVYTIKKGDSLWNIARKYGTTVNQIITCNKISNPNLIYPGQKIRIRVVNGIDVSTTNQIRYVVKKGDTLSEIARKYNTTVKKIAADNGIKNVNLIYIGQVIEL